MLVNIDLKKRFFNQKADINGLTTNQKEIFFKNITQFIVDIDNHLVTS